MAGLYSIYKTCFNQICTSTCPLSNAKVRIIVPQPRDIPADVMPDKVVGELTKSINN